MFIPEIGTKIVLLENLTFIPRNRQQTITIEKGLKLSVKKIEIKKGGSLTNNLSFSVLKCKENKLSPHHGNEYSIRLFDLNEMEFELEQCNDDTKIALIKTLEDVQNKLGLSYGYRKIESVLLDSKNIISFSPQHTPMVFFKKAIERMENRENEYKEVMSYDKLYTIVNKHFRKNKIAELLKEDV